MIAPTRSKQYIQVNSRRKHLSLNHLINFLISFIFISFSQIGMASDNNDNATNHDSTANSDKAGSQTNNAEKTSTDIELITRLNQSGDMMLLSNYYITRYASNVTMNNSNTLTLISRRLKYRNENAAMFKQAKIPDAVPHLQADIQFCRLKKISVQLPGLSVFSKPKSDPVLPITFHGPFENYKNLTDKSTQIYNKTPNQFEYFIRATLLFDILDSLQKAKIKQCLDNPQTSNHSELKIQLTSIYQTGEISREQAQAIIKAL